MLDYAFLKALIDKGFNITIASVFSNIVFSVCLLGIFAIVIRQQYLNRIRYNWLLACMIFVGVRMLLPIEILDFSYEIFVPYVMSDITSFLGEYVFVVRGDSISRIRFVSWVWLAGMVFMLGWTIIKYQRTKYIVTGFSAVKNLQVWEVLEKVNKNYGKRKKFQVVTSSCVSSPMVIGLKYPYVILPIDAMTEKQLYYTFFHELAHYYGGDLYLKFFCEIAKSVLWWNPLIYLFQKQFCGLLELRADDRVVSILDDKEKLEYADCLVQMAKGQKKSSDLQEFMLAYSGTRCFSLKHRIEILLRRVSDAKERRWLSDVIVAICVLLTLLIPNVIFEPDSSPEPMKGEVFTHTESFTCLEPGVFLIKNQDGTYDFYSEYEYCFTTEEVFDLTLRIYQSLEEAMENEQKNN